MNSGIRSFDTSRLASHASALAVSSHFFKYFGPSNGSFVRWKYSWYHMILNRRTCHTSGRDLTFSHSATSRVLNRIGCAEGWNIWVIVWRRSLDEARDTATDMTEARDARARRWPEDLSSDMMGEALRETVTVGANDTSTEVEISFLCYMEEHDCTTDLTRQNFCVVNNARICYHGRPQNCR